MAITEVYVDPSINADSGNGTSLGTAYGDLQYAINNTTLGTNGTRFNIVSGTAEVLTAVLNFTTGFTGTISSTQPVFIQGCTSTPGDGGRGAIEGTTNSVAILTDAGTAGDITFIDMDITAGATLAFQCNNRLFFYNCKIVGVEQLSLCNAFQAIGCYVTATASTSVPLINQDNNTYNIWLGNYVVGGATHDPLLSVRRSSMLFNVFNLKAGTVSTQDVFSSQGSTTAINNTAVGNANMTSNGGGFKMTAYDTYLMVNNAVQNTNTGEAIKFGNRNPLFVLNNAEWDTAGFDAQSESDGTAAVNRNNVVGTAAILVDATNNDFTSDGEAQEAGFPSSFLGLPGLTSSIDIGAVQYEPAAPPPATQTFALGMELLVPVS